MRTDDAIERCDDIGVTVIDRGDLGVDLGLLQIRLRIVTYGYGLIEIGLRRKLLGDQIGLTLVFRFSLFQGCLGACFGGLCLLQLQLVGFGFDGEERGALFHR
jgi:hypothetical protein